MVEEGKPGFFAIASAPGADSTSVELLIKSQPGSTAEAITSLAAGGELLVSSAQGKGEGPAPSLHFLPRPYSKTLSPTIRC